MKTAEARQPVHIGKVILNARIFKFREPRISVNDSSLLEAVNRFFALLDEHWVEYLLVGDIVLLQYVEGRNSEEIQIILSSSSLDRLPELRKTGQDGDSVQADFDGIQIGLLLTRNPLFDDVRRRYATRQRFIEREIPCATPEGLVLLKLYVLPSLYRQGDLTLAALYETDILTLMHRQRVDPEPLLGELESHLSGTDLRALRGIADEIRQRIERFADQEAG
jgi:hypothetical protein